MDQRRRTRPSAALAGVAVAVTLLLLLVLAAALSGPQATRLPVPATQAEQGAAPADQPSAPPAPSSSAQSAPPTTTPEWMPAALAVLGLLLVVFGVGALVSLLNRLRRRRRGPARDVRIRVEEADTPEPAPEHGEELRSTVQAGIDQLDEDAADPRAAVIGCWVALERLARAAGSEPRRADTSSDLVARLLGDHQVSEQSLRTFAALYQRARYAPADVDAGMRDQARAILVQLRTELTSPTGEREHAAEGEVER